MQPFHQDPTVRVHDWVWDTDDTDDSTDTNHVPLVSKNPDANHTTTPVEIDLSCNTDNYDYDSSETSPFDYFTSYDDQAVLELNIPEITANNDEELARKLQTEFDEELMHAELIAGPSIHVSTIDTDRELAMKLFKELNGPQRFENSDEFIEKRKQEKADEQLARMLMEQERNEMPSRLDSRASAKIQSRLSTLPSTFLHPSTLVKNELNPSIKTDYESNLPDAYTLDESHHLEWSKYRAHQKALGNFDDRNNDPFKFTFPVHSLNNGNSFAKNSAFNRFASKSSRKTDGAFSTANTGLEYNEPIVVYDSQESESSDTGMNNQILKESPLTTAKTRENLRKLLENVQHTTDVTPVHQRMATPENLQIKLLEHQKLGLEWMLKMENGTNKGGILADDMGLGKTIQSISLILSNYPSPEDHRPTLIVAPVSLLLQWQQELADRVKKGTLKVYLYYGSKRNKDIRFLEKLDVVITSFQVLGSEWPAPTKKSKVNFDSHGDLASDDEVHEDKCLDKSLFGPLFKLKFHRVILDEAHFIKNKRTRASIAACELQSRYRWCLTGTPVQNNISELYSLIRFLRIQPYCKWPQFREKIFEPFSRGQHSIAIRRLHAVMKAICLRRSKSFELDGKPIIQLPDRKIIIDSVEFTQPEREFYESLEKKQQLRFNAYLRAGTAMKNYTSILLLLLRLRQACCHPSLLSHDFEKIDDGATDEEKQQRIANIIDTLQPSIVARLKDQTFDECPICCDALQTPVFSPNCGHLFCQECVVVYLSSGEDASTVHNCPTCRGVMTMDTLVLLSSFRAKFLPEQNSGKIDKVVDRKGKGPALEQTDKNIESEQLNLHRWISSTKVERVIFHVKAIRISHPGEKTIVFSQFTKMLDLIETPLGQNNIKFTRYDGSMHAKQRDDSIRRFRDDPDILVILVSLKCGSLGLNLTCANRVILTDLWWNPAVENQAIDRAHRFGQTKDVIVHRIMIKNSVEDRILELQQRKQDIANQALGEGETGEIGNMRLGLGDLMHLFGVDG
ncbi:hypothetical protein O5D80_004108 [Batrachochytrium dendrobatidis]|nr:hypothetical protein O5D80_004108 [Batrachochytrium dendrobatidis]